MSDSLSSQTSLYAKWEDVERCIFDAVEGVLSDSDPTEGPALPAQIEWARDMAKLITQDAMRQLDGYEPGDISDAS